MLQTWVAPIVLSYLLGAVSFSYLLTRYLKGVDIRDYGSGNAGATNTSRVLGKGPAIIVFLLDALKGMAAVGIGSLLSNGNEIVMMLSGIAAIVGHNWPVFLRFRGGKGIATTVGVMALLVFYAALIAGVFAILFIFITRYVSLGSLIFTCSIPIALLVMGYSDILIWLSLVVALMAVIRHRQNIINLFKGQERKI
ncbi:glycerol-3-phosphate 1-O-acyltransferase PlsY [Paenactinomyces guangxiensis]|uniref:Glycerol-3-phosphate acyltransferase n=1 Tax=Paenactinomyces guangxiensis TaxID=1490290 RepID=A0A7W2A9W2_9BACL|nr:glycerol-3-phosphate 1-O-acyltransferase PlsY [Paenactinomyces guangxiensis]MBA4495617.1 glycerol-3-phosphate 1-O-acyltransferase PlsY [Paenactinomyces guangxiensis]MBH8592605.1 glycerol-3-phosphate 1-O-acyltransferase PlsY [Paenactinomyces guangxiensis]